jgi:hypothetical protein
MESLSKTALVNRPGRFFTRAERKIYAEYNDTKRTAKRLYTKSPEFDRRSHPGYAPTFLDYRKAVKKSHCNQCTPPFQCTDSFFG